MSESAYLLDAIRTPFGRYGGALAGVRPDDLASLALSGLLDRSPGLDPAEIDDVLFGDANGDATVEGDDLIAFGNSFNSTNIIYDFDSNGIVDGGDLTALGNRFGVVI